MIRRGVAAGLLLCLAAVSGCGSSASSPAGEPSGRGAPSQSADRATPGDPAESAATPSAGVSTHGAGSSTPDESVAAPAQTGDPAGRRDAHRGDEPVALPAPGTYTYRVTGTASSTFGDQQIDEQSELTVERPNGNRERTTLRDREGSTTQMLVARPNGLFLAEIVMSRQGFTETFHPEDDAQLVSARPTTGESWGWQMRSDDGDYTLRARLTVAADDARATVDGRRVAAVRVSSVLVITGNDIRMRIHQDDLATRDGTVVREHAVGSGTAYGMRFHSDTTRRLVSAG